MYVCMYVAAFCVSGIVLHLKHEATRCQTQTEIVAETVVSRSGYREQPLSAPGAWLLHI